MGPRAPRVGVADWLVGPMVLPILTSPALELQAPSLYRCPIWVPRDHAKILCLNGQRFTVRAKNLHEVHLPPTQGLEGLLAHGPPEGFPPVGTSREILRSRSEGGSWGSLERILVAVVNPCTLLLSSGTSSPMSTQEEDHTVVQLRAFGGSF